jgi:hypothetical protein
MRPLRLARQTLRSVFDRCVLFLIALSTSYLLLAIVAGAAPNISADVATSVTLGAEAIYDAGMSSGTGPLAYHWDFGDGTFADSARTSHTCSAEGRYVGYAGGLAGAAIQSSADNCVVDAYKTTGRYPSFIGGLLGAARSPCPLTDCVNRTLLPDVGGYF